MASASHRSSNRALQLPVDPARIFLALYAIALVIGSAVGFLLRFRSSPFQLEADEREYFTIAQSILSGTVDFNPRRSLGFPLIEAAFLRISDNFAVLQFLMMAVFALSGPLLFLLVRRLTGDTRIAVASALALMVWPPALYFGVSLYSEAAALPMVLATLVLLPVGSRLAPASPRGAMLALASGICLGLTTHVRSMYQLFLPVMLLVVLFEERSTLAAIKRFALVLAGFALVIAPWSIFMSNRYHHPILVTSNGGETLAGGLNPELLKLEHNRPFTAPGRTTWVGPGKWLTLNDNGYLTKQERTLPYDQMDALLKARALEWAEQNPGQASYLEGSKLAYLWGLSSALDNGPLQTMFGNIPTILLLLAALVCLLRFPDVRSRYSRLWLLPLFVSGVALISWGSWRFRQVGDAGLIAICAIGAFAQIDRRLSAKQRPTQEPVAG